MSSKPGTCPTCGAPFPVPPPGKALVWSIHYCSATPAYAPPEQEKAPPPKGNPK
jgi:hypothetical protein